MHVSVYLEWRGTLKASGPLLLFHFARPSLSTYYLSIYQKLIIIN